ncbi:MAG: VCBS repeat-containing protein [Planctomycetes bacterium]|nr:VCBS repeat-containing protein [Planctomycetota bacterium]
MLRSARTSSLIALSRCLVLLAAASGTAEAQLPPSKPTDAVASASPRLPVFFVENRGQWAGEARYAGNTAGYAVAFHDDRVVLTRANEKGSATVELAFVGARAKPEGEDPLRARVSYFVGERSSWRSNLESCAAVRYRGLWPGVDLRFYEHAGALEYDVILAPGADLAPVEFEVRGAAGLAVESDGGLLLRTELGDLRQAAPRTWEVAEDGAQNPVLSSFAIRAPRRYGFDVTNRDPRATLIVDPVLTWATYLGSSGLDWGTGLCVDASGAVYVSGASSLLQGTPGSLQVTPAGSSDVFVAKLDPDHSGTTQILWITYLGGSSGESFPRISLTPTGELALVGRTDSEDFPLTSGAFSGTGQAFLSKISADGSTLLYSSRLQGTFSAGNLQIEALVVDPNGSIWVGGVAGAGDWPTSPGAHQPSYAGANDAWIGRFDLSRSGSAQLIWATYFGGPYAEFIYGLALSPHSPDVITFCGGTSSGAACPRDYTTGAFLGLNWMVGQFDTAQSGAAQRRFVHVIGNGNTDIARDVAMTPAGELYVAGSFDFDEGHVLKISANGASVLADELVFNLGTLTGSAISDLFVSNDGTVTVVGTTGHAAALSPTPDAVQSVHGGFLDSVICQMDATLAVLRYATYFGGPAQETTSGSCAQLSGSTLTLLTNSYGAGSPVLNPYQSSFQGGVLDLHLSRFELPFGGDAGPGLAPRDLALLDLDADGDLDVATANEGSDDLSLRTNDGQGALNTELMVALTAADDAPIALASCDLDADGARDDLAVACAASSTLVLVTNPSSASPTRLSLAVAGQRPSCVAAGDLDADPRDDLIVGREGLPLSGGAGLAVVRNGGAAIDLAIPAPHPTQIARVALGDLDGDGDLDLAALARGGSDAVLLFAGDGAGALVFAGSLALASSGLASSLALADLDGDGRNDLAAVQPALFPPAQTLRVFRRTSTGPLSPALFTLAPDLATSGTLAIDLAVGDVEGDSIPGQLARLELAHANAGDGTVTLRHGYTGSAFLSSSSPTVGTNPVAVALGDLNGDGCDDLVVANQGSNDVTVVLSTPTSLAQSYGATCGGPLIAALGSPTLGNSAFAIELTGGRAFSPALFLFSSTPVDLPLPPSACNLYLGAPLSSLLRFTSGSGRAVLPIGIPNWPALRGVDLYFQGAVFRSPGGALDGTLDLSDALRVQVGS